MHDKQTIKKVTEVENVEELASMRQSQNINVVHEETFSIGDRIADRMAEFAGSWTFILSFLSILILWITLNSVQLLFHSFDPFPFILLNLVLSCVAAMQAPVIMMSQNRQEKKDRIRAEHDYEVNLKAEILIEEILKRLKSLEDNHKIIQENQLELMKLMSNKLAEKNEKLT
jgi:uncharacterized membrane protein